MKLKDCVAVSLAELTPFADCSRSELAFIAKRVSRVRVPHGKVLAAEGEVGREFLVIVEGTALVESGGRVVGELGRGDFLGELALLGGVTRSATVTATSPVVAEVCNKGEFAEILDASPAVVRSLLQGIGARRVREAGSTSSLHAA